MFQHLTFRHPFRKYQRLILAQVESGQGDQRYHLVAPPGAGKTIVGLELIRYFNAPAVIFAPTTTIQEQWRDKLALFLPADAPLEDLHTLVSLDPARTAPINIFTYQLISTPGESQTHVEAMARQRWIEDLLHEGKAREPADAEARLLTLAQNNPAEYRRELARRYQRIKRELLRSGEAEILPFLHPNARQLIETLVEYGVRTIVLDECHHLLDYWAIVLRYFIARIADPRIIGLTATLPSPEDDIAYENYTELLGEVDFEIPTPAVVKEGDLAPYRDLVYFVEPSPREMAYLKNIQQAFEAAISGLTRSAAFRGWVIQAVLQPTTATGTPLTWEQFVRQHPLFSLAGLRFLLHIAYPLPPDLPLPVEAEQRITLDDWAILLERYGLDVLALSPEPQDHVLLKRLRQILFPFGFTLTERGLRQSRSPGDLILTFSESKDEAVAHILSLEAEALGQQLRAVVVSDFEQMSSSVRRAGDVLDRDAGSAVRVFYHLVRHPQTGRLEPLLVTGRTFLMDADIGAEVIARCNAALEAEGARATCRAVPTAMQGVLEVVGEGPDWGSRTYVRLATRLFEDGLTRCLVGTRGIFGEGWDSLSLNTLIDLTSVTTSTSVQQLRGRSIRLDPRCPRKVAHNWDVICVAKHFERGDLDLRRLDTRHGRYWGIVPLSRREALVRDAQSVIAGDLLAGELRGQIVKGLNHLSPELAYQLATRGFKHADYPGITRQMLGQIKQRDKMYDLWDIGGEYSNFAYKATRLDATDLKIRTVFTVQHTLKRMLRAFLASLVSGLLMTLWLAAYIFLQGFTSGDEEFLGVMCGCSGGILALGLLLTLAFNTLSAYRLGKTLLVEQPTDGILLDMGRALLATLKELGLVSRHLQPDYIRVVEHPDNSYDVLLDYASPEEAALFIETYQELFEPVRDQRYLIYRDDTRLPSLPLRPLWYFLRRLLHDEGLYKPAYHPVPKLLASRKDRAEAFAHAWQKYVGGGYLIYTRSDAGRRILLEARAQQRPKVKGLAFELWR